MHHETRWDQRKLRFFKQFVDPDLFDALFEEVRLEPPTGGISRRFYALRVREDILAFFLRNFDFGIATLLLLCMIPTHPLNIPYWQPSPVASPQPAQDSAKPLSALCELHSLLGKEPFSWM